MMFRVSYDKIINKIKSEKGLSDEDLNFKINTKLKQLSGLISREGAAHIVANELGVKVFEGIQKKVLKVSDIFAGMRSVELAGRIVRKFEVRSFKTTRREGRVASFLLGDNTGIIRIVLWDENHINQFDNFTESDIVKLTGGYAKENNNYLEIHLGSKSKLLLNPENVDIPEFSASTDFTKKFIKDLNQGDLASISGTVVQVFEPRFYDACPECNKKLVDNSCPQHGPVTPNTVPIINIFFDDGSDNLRAVFFRDSVNKLLNADPLQFKENGSAFEDLRRGILGKQLKLVGRASKNAMFDRMEFVVNELQELSPKQLTEELLKDFESE